LRGTAEAAAQFYYTAHEDACASGVDYGARVDIVEGVPSERMKEAHTVGVGVGGAKAHTVGVGSAAGSTYNAPPVARALVVRARRKKSRKGKRCVVLDPKEDIREETARAVAAFLKKRAAAEWAEAQSRAAQAALAVEEKPKSKKGKRCVVLDPKEDMECLRSLWEGGR
jgi:hypothetical protein